jgi:alpha-L-rhamnosidase
MTKWMYDVVDAQAPDGAFMDTSPFVDKNGTFGAPGWGDAGIIVPWNIYRCYGDTRIINEHFDAMERWMKYMAVENPDFLRKNRRNNDYGDWLSIEAETPKDLLATAFWAYDAWLMADMAKATGRTEAQQRYEKVFASVKSAFQKAYISSDGKVHGATQTGYVLALAFNLMPDHLRQTAAQFLVDDINAKGGHLSTGFIGVKYLNPLLTEMGHVDIAYNLLFNKTFPSWGFPITQGATTIWERWDGWTTEKGFQDPGMNSFNHYSMGSVGEWLFRHVAGIDLGEKPGYKEIVVHPHVAGQLSNVNGSYISPQGMIRSAWEQKSGKVKLHVTIPANTLATICVPARSANVVREGGKPALESPDMTFVRHENGFAIFKAGSGNYTFETVLK